MRISSDRALYLSRLILQKLKQAPKLSTTVDDDTLRRAVMRAVTESSAELEKIEAELKAKIEKRRGAGARDVDLLFSRELESELRKHGV